MSRFQSLRIDRSQDQNSQPPALNESGHELLSSWVLDELETGPDVSVNIFSIDIDLKECDLLAADVTNPSTGVRMEVMLAYLYGKKIVLIAGKGSVVTRLLTDMDNVQRVECEDEQYLYENLSPVPRNLFAR